MTASHAGYVTAALASATLAGLDTFNVATTALALDTGTTPQTSLVIATVEDPNPAIVTDGVGGCKYGGWKITAGLDTDSDGALDPSEVTNTAYACNGATGDAGASGYASLVRAVAVTSPCIGNRIEWGLDNGDGGGIAGNSTFEAGEVDGSTVVCDGATGPTGGSGAPGYASLVRAVAVTSPCVGNRIEWGLDNGDGGGIAGNNTFEAGEVDGSTVVCNGTAGSAGLNAVVAFTAEPANPSATDGVTGCVYGGTKVSSGLDSNLNGALDGGEITATSYVCDANTPPIALGATLTVLEDNPLALRLLAHDLNGQAVTFIPGTGPANGTLGGTFSTGDITYTPDPDFNGQDSFTFTASDGTAASATATVTVNVLPVNDAPVAHAGYGTLVHAGETVTLDGSRSSDAEGGIVAYRWRQVGGSFTPVLDRPDGVRPTFRHTSVWEEYVTFELTAIDKQGARSTDTVSYYLTYYLGGAAFDTAGIGATTINPLVPRNDDSGTSDAWNVVLYKPGDGNTYGLVPDVAGGLLILNLNDIANGNITKAARYTHPFADHVTDVVVRGNEAFLGDDGRTLVVNISDPFNPVSGPYSTQSEQPFDFTETGAETAMVLSGNGNCIFLANEQTLYTLNISNLNVNYPRTEVPISDGMAVAKQARAIAISGTTLAVLHTGGLALYDVSTPSCEGPIDPTTPIPTPIGYYDDANTPSGIVLSGTTVFYTPDALSVKAVSIADPANPALLGTVDTVFGAGRKLALSADGNTLYMATPGKGALIFDVTDPAAMALIAEANYADASRGIAVDGTTLYIAAGSAGVGAFDVATPAFGSGLGVVAGTGEVQDADGDLAVRATGGALDVVDGADPAAPSVLGTGTINPGADAALRGGLAYVATQGSLEIWDVTSPSAPLKLSTFTATVAADGDDITRVFVRDRFAYLLDDTALVVVDVTDPRAPVQVGRASIATPPPPASPASLARRYLYRALDASVEIWDLADPVRPMLMNTVAVGSSINDVAAIDDTAFLVSNNGETHLYSVNFTNAADPLAFTTNEFLGQPQLWNLAYAGGRLYASEDNRGLIVYDVADASSVTRTGQHALDVRSSIGQIPGRVTPGKDAVWVENDGDTDTAARGIAISNYGLVDYNYVSIDYDVAWRRTTGAQPVTVKCFVTEGTCSITSTDQINGKAVVNWDLSPLESSDQEMLILVGNQWRWHTARDKISVFNMPQY
ncbi:MAG: cadherin-like domain-containing protein [Candidatus Lambdaproteobacteria bacterium]|nr:cadherin-like domain-containing protein [Candidatus Lambdaproteobacteria bacterium]